MIKAIIALVTISGVATVYLSESHEGNPLYCDTSKNNLSYREGLSFVAVPVELYESGQYKCGDEVIVYFDDGTRLYSFALDAGKFGKNCVIQPGGECIKIVVDIPSHLWSYHSDISHKASITNISLANRMLPKDVMIDYLKNE